MSDDQASLLDQVVHGEDLPIQPVEFLLVVKIFLIAVVGSAFFALNRGSIAIIAVLVAFIAALEYSNSIGGGVILRGSQSPFQASLSYWLPQFVFFIPGVIAVLQGFVSAFAGDVTFAFSFGASETYLSFINNTEPWFVNVVNYDLATHIENWLIIPSGAVIFSFIRKFTDRSVIQAAAVGAASMGLIFSLLHGITILAFTLFAFGFMFMLIMSIIYEDSNEGELIPFGLATLVASIGWHRGFNISSLSNLLEYYNQLLSLSGDFRLIGVGIVLIDLIILAILVVGVFRRAGDYIG